MKKTIGLLLNAVCLGLMGCANHRDYAHYPHRYYVSEEYPRTVIIEPDGTRTYVREYDRDTRGSPYYQNNMEPRVRGKHADALGWNSENYYIQRGYRD